MPQYINKDIVKAELEKRKIPFKKDIDDGVYPTYLCALMDFEDFIDTLEVKGVDLNNGIQLTWEDIRELYIIFAEVDVDIELCKTADIQAETIGYYQEVLKRFKELKGE